MEVWKCACCGCQEPFPCDCPTDVAYSDADGSSAWKGDILKRNSFATRARWHLFKWLSHVGWWVCPEPHRSRLQRGIGSWQEVEARANRRQS